MDWLRSLGNVGAIANARALHMERRREDWIVDALTRSLPSAPTVEPAARAA